MESDNKKFRQVGIGLMMVVASLVILFLYVFSIFASPLIPLLNNPTVSKAVLFIQIQMALPILITSSILGVAGPCLCLATPREVKVTGYLLISIALSGGGFLISSIGMIIDLPGWLSVTALFLPLISILMFLVFVRKLAIYLESEKTLKSARDALWCAGLSILFVVVQWAFINYGPVLSGNGPLVLGLLTLFVFLGLVFAFLRYMTMLTYAGKACYARGQ